MLFPSYGVSYILELTCSETFFFYFILSIVELHSVINIISKVPFFCPQVRSAVRKRWHRWQDKHSIRARVARAMSIPTSPTRVSFHSIKQSSAV